MEKVYQKVMNTKYRNNRFITKIRNFRDLCGEDMPGKFKFGGVLTRISMTADGIEVMSGNEEILGFRTYDECAVEFEPTFIQLALHAAKRVLLRKHPEYRDMFRRTSKTRFVRIPRNDAEALVAFCEENGNGDAEFCVAVREILGK